MKTASLMTALAAGVALAYPGMDMDKIIAEARIQARQLGGGGPSTELIGDLARLPDDMLTETGQAIKAILTVDASGSDEESTYEAPGPKGSPECKADKCCVWKFIADDMASQMVGNAGRCNSVARGAVRLGFHDAASWSKTSGGTGADGSLILANECKTRSDNKGLEEICDTMEGWFNKYKKYGVTMADMIQFGANVATVSCPLGPRVRTFVGRKDTTKASPQNLLPSPFQKSDALFKMFAEKSFTPAGLVALLGAHTTSQQRFIDESKAGAPQDTTPGVWDVAFYGQTLSPRTPPAVFKIPSDVSVSQDPETNDVWTAFSAGFRGQAAWNQAYATEYVRMSMLGVPNMNDLTECTKVLPPFKGRDYQPPDQEELTKFMNGLLKSPAAFSALDKGDKIPPNTQ
ncbi:ligninase h2 precursor [Colletotrichum musicola]|uniref:Peroxidase n=2 Tax=Colletotrichum orchidearum species complex TaxID=2707337 RepID=A0A8H6MX66_9PEZI|nr:ligninase h2 precursor [Colletotrichum musicola]KAF6823274.1 ligninase h2 precursor [Colletotrichum plurivorum]